VTTSIPDQTSRVELLTCAYTSTRGILENVDREQMALPTPCRKWDVRELINHILGSADFFTDLAERGSCPDDREWPEYADGDFVSAFDDLARRLLTAFSAPGAMERTMLLPIGPAPGSRCIQVATGEIFVHGWDLAAATRQALDPDLELILAEALLASEWPSLSAGVRDAHPSIFAPEIAVPDRAPAIDRLVGFLGREPHWSSGG
jgi:uncharacterized protein (TIGR03086 family)